VIALAGRSLRGSLCCGLTFGLALFVPLRTWLLNVAWYAFGALAGAEAVIFALLAVGQRLLLRLAFWPAAVAGWGGGAEGFRDRWAVGFPRGARGDEPVRRAGRPLGRRRRGTPADLPGRAGRRARCASGASCASPRGS